MANKTAAGAQAASPPPAKRDYDEPGPQPPISDEPPIPDAEELPGTPRPGQPARPEARQS